MPVSVALIQNGKRVALDGTTEVSVAEGPISVVVSADVEPLIRFDDRRINSVALGDGRSYLFDRDLSNEIGFHRIVVELANEVALFDFRTNSTKATWDEIRAMASHLGRVAFAYRRQFVYSTPDGRRESVHAPEVEFGWLRERIPEIVRLVNDIAAHPAFISKASTRTSFRGGDLAISRTLVMLRERPELLEQRDGGPIEYQEKQFWPAAIKVRIRKRHWAVLEHQQIAHLLRLTAVAANRIAPLVVQAERSDLEEWQRRISAARSSGPIRAHDNPSAVRALTPVPTQLQRTDRRYRRLRQLHLEYLREFSTTNYTESATRTNIRDAWEIFQVYVAQLAGAILGLRFVSDSNDLRVRDQSGRSMTSDDIDLYYNVVPPATVVESWRDLTNRPANERPDILLHDRRRERVALLDAKFRKDSETGRAPSGALQEMQAYLHSYGLSRGAIVYPDAKAAISAIAGRGNEILEVPISASDADRAMATLGDAIERLWEPQPR